MNERKLFQNITQKDRIKNQRQKIAVEVNSKKLKSKSGITLIALVISIIVMLILAGVSLNATIGDNGIITQAQNATYMQSVAVLEDFFQQKYVELYDTIETPKNKLDYFLNDIDGSKKYIQKSMNNSYYFMDNKTGNTYYFIEKSALPDEIKNQIKGGDTTLTNKTIWADFNDIYGITSDLKVYYCSNSSESRIGATDESLQAELSKPIAGMSAGSDWAKALGFDRDVTYQDLLGIDELTITNSNLDLKLMYNLGSLKNLTFTNVEMENLDGINNAINLDYLFFYNSKIGNYSSLGKCDKLNKLYFHFTSSMNEDDTNKQISNLCDENVGIAKADLSKLEYFGIFGVNYVNYKNNYKYITDYSATSNLTDISALNKLESKKYIKYIFLNNNKISSLEGLKGFNNLYQLVMWNDKKINNFLGLQDLSNLKYIYAQYCDLYYTSGLDNCTNLFYLYIVGNAKLERLNNLQNCNQLNYIYATGCKLGKNENATIASSEDALYSLSNITSLKVLNLKNNDLKRVEYLKNLTNLSELNLEENSNLNTNSLLEIKNIIQNCKNLFTIDSKYSLILLDDKTSNLSLSGQKINKENFELLKNKSRIEKLDLSNFVLVDNIGNELSAEETNNTINDVLKTLNNVKYLNLSNISQLSTITFAKNMQSLVEIVLFGTNVTTGTKDEIGENTGLEILNNLKHMEGIGLDNPNIELAEIIPTINRLVCRYVNYPERFLYQAGLVARNSEMFNSLNNSECGLESLGLMNLSTDSIIDLSQCTTLKNVVLIYGSTYKVKLPDSVTSIYLDSQYLYGAYPQKLKNVTFINRCLNDDVLNNLSNNCIELQEIWTGNSYDLTNLSCLKNAKFKNTLKILSLNGNDACMENNSKISDISPLTSYTNLEKISIFKASISSLNGVENLPKLNTLSLPQNKIVSLENLKGNLNLQKLELPNNRVYSLHGLENLTQLKYIDLQNNCLQDIIQYTDENNEVKTVRNLSIAKNLNTEGSLKNLLLNGNSNLTEFSEIKNLNWSSKNGF